MGKKEDVDEVANLYYGQELSVSALVLAWEAGFRAGQEEEKERNAPKFPAPNWGREEER